VNRKTKVVLSLLLLCVGLCVLLYPAVSNRINRLHSSYAIQNLNVQMESVEQQQLKAQLEQAEIYNALLRGEVWTENAEHADILDEYNQILNFGNGIMGAIQIPRIDLNLPIYHGVSDGILAKAVGHLPQSAFPIGGEGNHAVLTGHTGLPGAELFTDLTKLQEEDRFYIMIADRTLCYQVDQIKVVLPYQTEDLAAVEGEDFCTLVTCTPYGVNSHRLLLRGKRVVEDAKKETASVEAGAFCCGELIASGAVMIAGLMAVLLITFRLLSRKRRG